MGDEPCEEDCAIFGMLAQLKWQSPESLKATHKQVSQPGIEP